MAKADDPEKSEDRNQQDRNETPTERLDRNWGDLLQELRVVQTGVQLLTGFLLTLPFQQKFPSLSVGERRVYMAAVSASIIATGFLQAPVSVHRALFRRHRRKETVALAHRLAIVGIFFLACAVVSVTTLIFSVLLGWTDGLVFGGLCTALLLMLWLVVPWSVRLRSPSKPPQELPESGPGAAT
jgi:O-antigen/teichoic acid export membrane protein